MGGVRGGRLLFTFGCTAIFILIRSIRVSAAVFQTELTVHVVRAYCHHVLTVNHFYTPEAIIGTVK